MSKRSIDEMEPTGPEEPKEPLEQSEPVNETNETKGAGNNLIDLFIPEWTPERVEAYKQVVQNTRSSAEKEAIVVLWRCLANEYNHKGLAPVHGPRAPDVVRLLRSKGYEAKIVDYDRVQIDFSTIVSSSTPASPKSIVVDQPAQAVIRLDKKFREAIDELIIVSIALKKDIFVDGVFELKGSDDLINHITTYGPPLMHLLKNACRAYNGQVVIDPTVVESFVYIMKHIDATPGAMKSVKETGKTDFKWWTSKVEKRVQSYVENRFKDLVYGSDCMYLGPDGYYRFIRKNSCYSFKADQYAIQKFMVVKALMSGAVNADQLAPMY